MNKRLAQEPLGFDGLGFFGVSVEGPGRDWPHCPGGCGVCGGRY
jgi:hypothetical protein